MHALSIKWSSLEVYKGLQKNQNFLNTEKQYVICNMKGTKGLEKQKQLSNQIFNHMSFDGPE